MKTQTNTKALVVLASLVAVVGVATAFQSNNVTATAKSTAQKVVISAKRMSAEEKLAYDLQSTGMQTVVISAKRLTPEQKLAMAQQDRAWQVAQAPSNSNTHKD